MVLADEIRELIPPLALHLLDPYDLILAAARAWLDQENAIIIHDPVWKLAHRLREAIYDTFANWNVENLADAFKAIQDDGVTQAWMRVALGIESALSVEDDQP